MIMCQMTLAFRKSLSHSTICGTLVTATSKLDATLLLLRANPAACLLHEDVRVKTRHCPVHVGKRTTTGRLAPSRDERVRPCRWLVIRPS